MTNETIATASGAVRAAGGDVRTYARVFWRWKFLLLAFVVVIPVASYFYERGRPKVYQSSSLLEVTGGQETGIASLFNQVVQSGPDTTDLLAAARLITTPGFAKKAARYLTPPPANPTALLGNVTASADATTGFITITADAGSPTRAAAIANAFARAVVTTQTHTAIKQLDIAITQLSQQLTSLAKHDPSRTQLSDELARFKALRAAQGGNAQVVQPAVASSNVVAPHVIRTVILALIVALLLGFGAVALAETSDRRIRHPDDAGDSTGLPLLSAIPTDAFSSRGIERHQVQESFATLRASLMFFNVESPVSSVLVTSPGKDDGKTTVAVQLARALANTGKDVVLVDADLRRPAAAGRLGLPPSDGLGSVLAGELTLDEALVDPESANGRRGRLRVLPAGKPPPNPAELLGSARMRELISELTKRSDIVVIDSTPLLTVSDSMALVQVVSGVVLIARVNRTSREAMARLKFVVESAGGRALGVVATASSTGGLYVAPGYGYETAYVGGSASANGSGRRRSRRWRRDKRAGAVANGDGGSRDLSDARDHGEQAVPAASELAAAAVVAEPTVDGADTTHPRVHFSSETDTTDTLDVEDPDGEQPDAVAEPHGDEPRDGED